MSSFPWKCAKMQRWRCNLVIAAIRDWISEKLHNYHSWYRNSHLKTKHKNTVLHVGSHLTEICCQSCCQSSWFLVRPGTHSYWVVWGCKEWDDFPTQIIINTYMASLDFYDWCNLFRKQHISHCAALGLAWIKLSDSQMLINVFWVQSPNHQAVARIALKGCPCRPGSSSDGLLCSNQSYFSCKQSLPHIMIHLYHFLMIHRMDI